jgi:hypothetical protein
MGICLSCFSCFLKKRTSDIYEPFLNKYVECCDENIDDEMIITHSTYIPPPSPQLVFDESSFEIPQFNSNSELYNSVDDSFITAKSYFDT